MPKYLLETRHRFVIETDDIRQVLLNYEAPYFGNCSLIGEAEFVDGSDTYEVIDGKNV